MITNDEIDTFTTRTLDGLHNFKINLLQMQVAPLVGKTVQILRFLKDPVSEAKIQHDLDATITGAQWTHDDGIDFEAFHKTDLNDSDAMFKTMTSSTAERDSCCFEPIAHFIND